MGRTRRRGQIGLLSIAYFLQWNAANHVVEAVYEMQFRYERETVTAWEFAHLLDKSGLASRRPASDIPRLQRMLDNGNLIVTARVAEIGQLVGIARSLTDWSYATYLSDLAVDAAFKGGGIGRRLIEETRNLAGEEAMLLLVSAPDAVGFYHKLGMPVSDRAFLFPRAR
jgi:GNAT superfamily N-acetyltransferase